MLHALDARASPDDNTSRDDRAGGPRTHGERINMGFGDGLFYFPTQHVYGKPETHELTYESVSFDSTDGARLHGWFFPAVGSARGTVIQFHGNAGNITGHFESVKWLPSESWNVFCFDYRGYGQSTGKPTRQGTVNDGLAAIECVQSRGDVDADRVVVLGQSLGGAVGIVVVAQCSSVRGIAVEGAFSHYRTEAAFVCGQNIFVSPIAGLLSRAMISQGLDPIDCVASIAPRPTMFVCGTNDRIVDHNQTAALHAAAAEPKTLHVIEGGGHTDSMCASEGRRWFLDFFDACLAR